MNECISRLWYLRYLLQHFDAIEEFIAEMQRIHGAAAAADLNNAKFVRAEIEKYKNLVLEMSATKEHYREMGVFLFPATDEGDSRFRYFMDGWLGGREYINFLKEEVDEFSYSYAQQRRNARQQFLDEEEEFSIEQEGEQGDSISYDRNECYEPKLHHSRASNTSSSNSTWKRVRI
jgi:hypothetical protein